MLVSAKMARAIVEEAWIARRHAPPRQLMVGPSVINPFRKTVIVETSDHYAGGHYVEGTFTWFPTRVTFSQDITLKRDEAPVVSAARQDPEIAGILVWSRFPYWEIREVTGGTEVRLRDMRFKRLGAGSFTAATVVR
jgi:hypothetical protein